MRASADDLCQCCRRETGTKKKRIPLPLLPSPPSRRARFFPRTCIPSIATKLLSLPFRTWCRFLPPSPPPSRCFPPPFFFTRFSTSSLAPQFREAHHLCKHSTSSSSPPLFICFSRCVLPSPSHFVNRWRRGCEANIERDWSILRRGVARKRFVGKLLLRLPPARADVDSEVSLASQSSFNFFSSSRSFSVSPCLFLSLS